jgi:hypothetical protein
LQGRKAKDTIRKDITVAITGRAGIGHKMKARNGSIDTTGREMMTAENGSTGTRDDGILEI